MSDQRPDSRPRTAKAALHANRFLVAVAIIALIGSLAFFGWTYRPVTPELNLGSSVELLYRKGLLDTFIDEAKKHDLVITSQKKFIGKAADAIEQVDTHELDATVVPAGLKYPGDNVRQVAVFDCEPLHLFVKPEMLDKGVASLKGKRINLGPDGTGARALGEAVLSFIGLKKPGEDYLDLRYSYSELVHPAADQIRPDAVFALSPLPSPFGEALTRQGYFLMELPFGAAMALRNPTIEDICIPPHTYSVDPAVPSKPLHTIGTRPLLVANVDVPKATIRQLLEVLYESDFVRRAGLPPLDPDLISRSCEYPNHPGTIAYLHRHDPWVNKDFVDNFTNLRGLLVPIVSAGILIWQWIRRRRIVGLNDYLRACTKLELDATHAASQGNFGKSDLETYQAKLNRLKLDVLEKHEAGVFNGDEQFGIFLARVDSLRETLPVLVRPVTFRDLPTISLGKSLRKAG